MLLTYSRNYSYILAVIVSLVLTSMVLGPFGFDDAAFRVVAIMMPLSIAFLLVSEIRSGMAFNSRWVAQYRRGTWQFTGLIIWHTFGLLFFSIISALSFGLFD